jgi:hypothetical protein
MSDVIELILKDLKGVMQSIAKLADKNLVVLSAEELLTNAKMVAKPAGGVIYEGMRSVAEPGPSARAGLSAEAIFTILIVADGANLNTAAEKFNNLYLLGQLRSVLKARKSPTGHIYRFMVESPADEKAGIILWAQRWSVPVPMI